MQKIDVIEKVGSQWFLYNKAKTKVLGKFGSEKAAKERERQIEYFKHKKDALPKLSKLTAPMGIERDYQTNIRKLVTREKDIIDKMIVQNLPTIMAETESFRPTQDSERFDQTIGEKTQELFRATRVQIDSQITDFEIQNMVQATAREIDAWNKAQITKVLKQGLGIDMFIAEPWLAQELNIFVINNVNLIKNVNQSFLDQTEQIVFDGMRRGLRHEQIAKQILGSGKDELGKVSRFRQAKTRANLIGRDQVNKLNGNLTRLRQTTIGVKEYIWRTVGDNRVRPDHVALNGQKFSWSKGAYGSIHPGDEINCRCYAEAVLDSLLK